MLRTAERTSGIPAAVQGSATARTRSGARTDSGSSIPSMISQSEAVLISGSFLLNSDRQLVQATRTRGEPMDLHSSSMIRSPASASSSRPAHSAGAPQQRSHMPTPPSSRSRRNSYSRAVPSGDDPESLQPG